MTTDRLKQIREEKRTDLRRLYDARFMLRTMQDQLRAARETVKRLTESSIPGYEKEIPKLVDTIKGLQLRIDHRYGRDSLVTKDEKIAKLEASIRKLRGQVAEERAIEVKRSEPFDQAAAREKLLANRKRSRKLQGDLNDRIDITNG